jgi:hypothetical protein
VPGAHVHRAVAELAEHCLLLALADQRERHPGRYRQLAGDDPPAAVVAARDVEHVHRAAAPVGAAVGAAEELRHHRVRRDPAGQREAVAAVPGDEQVVLLQRRHRADRRRLLPRGQVAVAADPRRLVLALRGLLEAADQEHGAVMTEKVVDVEIERGVGAVDYGHQGSSK